MKKNICKLLILILFSSCLNGCAVVLQKGRRSDIERIKELETRLNDLESTKTILEQQLQKEIADKQVAVSMEDRGLVITVLTNVLFDSGKAELNDKFVSILDRVAEVLVYQVPDRYIEVQGHTDNQPIKYSGWKSNWELSCARALSVVHYLTEQHDLETERIHASCFGEFRPVADNMTEEGRQKNRRVEIVILPEDLYEVKRVAPDTSTDDVVDEMYEENLK